MKFYGRLRSFPAAVDWPIVNITGAMAIVQQEQLYFEITWRRRQGFCFAKYGTIGALTASDAGRIRVNAPGWAKIG